MDRIQTASREATKSAKKTAAVVGRRFVAAEGQGMFAPDSPPINPLAGRFGAEIFQLAGLENFPVLNFPVKIGLVEARPKPWAEKNEKGRKGEAHLCGAARSAEAEPSRGQENGGREMSRILRELRGFA